MAENDFEAQVEELNASFYEGQLFEHHFRLFLDFLKDISRQRRKASNSAKYGEDLAKQEFRVTCLLRKIRSFQSVHCSNDLPIEGDGKTTIEEKLSQYSSLAGPDGETRRRIFALIKLCRGLLNNVELSESLTGLIMECIDQVCCFDQFFPGLSSHFPALTCKSSMEILDLDDEYSRRLYQHLRGLYDLREHFDPVSANAISQFYQNYAEITRRESMLDRKKRIDAFSNVFDRILLKYSFLPLFDPMNFELTHKMYNNRDTLRGTLTVNPDKNKMIEVMIQKIKIEKLEALPRTKRAEFIQLLTVLSQGERKDSGVLPVLGVVYFGKFLYLIFKAFYFSLQDVFITNSSRDAGDVFSIFKQLAKGLRFFHSNNIFHGNLSPSNIFILSDLVIRIGYVNVFESFIERMNQERDISWASTLLQRPWKQLVYIAPELYESQIELTLEKQADLGYNSSCDIFSLSICIYQLLAPLFASDLSSEASRKEAIDRYSRPYSHAMVIMTIEAEKKKLVKYRDADERLKSEYDRELAMTFATYVVKLRPDLPSPSRDKKKLLNSTIENILMAVKNCWSQHDFDRPEAGQVLSALRAFRLKIGSLSQVDYEGFQLVLRKYKGVRLSPDGLDKKELCEVLTEYFTQHKPSMLSRVDKMATSLGFGLSLEDFNSELIGAYGKGLDVKAIKQKYDLQGFTESFKGRASSTILPETTREYFNAFSELAVASTRNGSKSRNKSNNGATMYQVKSSSLSLQLFSDVGVDSARKTDRSAVSDYAKAPNTSGSQLVPSVSSRRVPRSTRRTERESDEVSLSSFNRPNRKKKTSRPQPRPKPFIPLEDIDHLV